MLGFRPAVQAESGQNQTAGFTDLLRLQAGTQVHSCPRSRIRQGPRHELVRLRTRDGNDIDNPTKTAKRSLRNLGYFQSSLLKATILVQGFVTVAVIPRSIDKEREQQDKKGRTKGEKKEEIVGVALWLPPGKTLDMGTITTLRSGLLKVLRGWGFSGVKRVLLVFSPAVERPLEKAFKARGLDRRDSWHLLEMVVDPLYQGQEGFRRASPKPVYLEATKASTRDIYAHFGFEINEEHQFGIGQVDESGVKARGEAATEYPEWVMTKWTTP